MRREDLPNHRAARLLPLLVGLVCLTALACDNSMNFNPVAPDWPDWQPNPLGTRTLQIDGVLQMQNGSCLEATVLYDGLEVAGARSRCPHPSGCTELELEASVRTATGHHTISFQVLRQSQEVVDYRAEGRVVVYREDVDLGGASLRLGPREAPLKAGAAVTFDVDFDD